MRELYAQRLLVLAAYLERVPTIHYRHSDIGRREVCGTVGCALGHAAVSGVFAGLEINQVGRELFIGRHGFAWITDGDLVFGPGATDSLFAIYAPWYMDRQRELRDLAVLPSGANFRSAAVEAIRGLVADRYAPELASLTASGWTAEAKLREYFPDPDRDIPKFLRTGKRPVRIVQPPQPPQPGPASLWMAKVAS